MKVQHFFFISVIVILASCKAVHLPEEPALINMPNAFDNSSHYSIDSLKLTQPKISILFTDEYLSELIHDGLRNNTDLRNTFYNIEIAKANQIRTKGLLLPELNFETNGAIFKYGDYTQEWAGNRTTEMTPNGPFFNRLLPNFYSGLTSKWEIDIYNKLRDRNKSAQARILSSVDGRSLIETNLVSEIAKAYYELVSLDNKIEIFQQSITIQENSLTIIRELKAAGRASELAVNQYESQILNTQAQALQLNQEIVELENYINQLLTRYPQKVFRNNKALKETEFDFFETGIPSDLLRNRPDIRMAEKELQATRFDTQAAKKEFYPSLRINTGIGFNGFSAPLLFTLPSVAFNFLGGLSAPVFNRKHLESDFKQASAMQLIALNNYQQSIVAAFTEVHNELKNIENLKSITELKVSEANSLENIVKNSDLLFVSNRASYLEVLTAQQNLLQAKLELVDLAKALKISSINLFKILGGEQE
jgi:multidrug efflux system outer membrane protein